MSIPLIHFTVGEGKTYFITVDYPPDEDVSMRRHFIKECGWTEREYNKIRDFAWFRVEVGLWLNGEQVNTQHLGCCCYKTTEEFHNKDHAPDYFADMVCEAAIEVKDTMLIGLTKAWRIDLRDERNRIDFKKKFLGESPETPKQP